MKKLICILFLLPMSLMATDVKEISLTEHARTWVNKYGEMETYVLGLKDDLFKTKEIKSSRGPKWAEKAIDALDEQIDVHESTSYWYERFDEGDCEEFTDDDLESAYADWRVDWRAIKPLQGSKKTLIYIMDLTTVIEANGKVCEQEEDSFLVLNKMDTEDKPIFLGRQIWRSERSQQFIGVEFTSTIRFPGYAFRHGSARR